MNRHLTQGFIAFIIWASFSTWYYVNYIKEWPEEVPIVTKESPIENEVPSIEQSADAPEEISDDPEPIVVPKVTLTAEVLFLLNQSKLVPSKSLTDLSDSMTSLTESGPFAIRIEGHTCDLGPTDYNDSLALVRAQSVAAYLKPVIAEEMKLEILSFGETQPLVPNTNEQQRAKNRRVHITLTN